MASGVLPRAGQITLIIRAFPRLASSIIQHAKTTLNMKSRTVPTVRSKCPWPGPFVGWQGRRPRGDTGSSRPKPQRRTNFPNVRLKPPSSLSDLVISKHGPRRPQRPGDEHPHAGQRFDSPATVASIRAQASLHDFSDHASEYAATSNILYLKFIDNSKS